MQDPLKLFEEELRSRPGGISAYTVRGYLADLRKFAGWFRMNKGEEMELGKVTPVDVRDYKAHLQTAASYKPATINRHLASLRAYFSWANEKGLVDENPVRVGNVEEQQAAPRSLDEKAYNKLLRETQKHGRKRDLAIIQLLRHTGIRLGELCDLTLADVETSELMGKVIVRSGNEDRYRAVPLNLDARRALGAYLEEERPEVDDRHLFIGQRRNGLTDAAVQNVVKKYADLAHLEGVSPHVLRHTFARSLLDKGVDLVTVQQLMGHKRVDSTARYARPGERDLEAAVSRLELEKAIAPQDESTRVQKRKLTSREKSDLDNDERIEPKWKQW
jgi:site-specific recombinase XerD